SMAEDLRDLPYVHAFWEGGAAAFNRVDTWSDLDLYVVVDDGMVPPTFEVVEKSLTALSPIQIRHEVAWPAASGISQRFYRLERATEFLLIDLAVLKASAPDKFLVPQIHGDAVFLFNKQNAISIPSFDAEAFIRGLLDRRKRLVERMALFGPFVEKEILRGNNLEALEFYRALVLPSLVEALRMRHGPRHYDFRMRYVYRELRPDLVRRLERLAFVADTKDLEAKYRDAVAWFRACKDRILMIVVLPAGAGAVGVGVFTENAPDGLHSIVSFITFLFAALSAILAFRVLRPPLSYLSVLLGVGSLLALVLYISKNDFDLGNGGMERMIVYPVLAWGIGFGGYLLGMAHGN